MLKESLRMSWQNICASKMRTFLTMLGIIIGVTAIIALITTVGGATDEITGKFSELGAGKISVNIMGTPLKRGLNESDLDKLAQVDNISGVDPTVSRSTYAALPGNMVENVTLEGRSASFFQGETDLMESGRGLTFMDMDRHSNVCVIDSDLRSKLFPGENPIGQKLVLSGRTFTIVGLLSDENNADMMSIMMGGSSNGKAIIPYPAALRINSASTITSLTVYLKDTMLADDTIADMEDVLNAAFNYRDDAYRIINIDSLLDAMDSVTSMMTTVLVGIASIALLVGGIGIMNIMLVNVSERTMEIGLRKALGAKPGVIQLQFLIESVMLSVMGGIIGIILGNAVSFVLADIIGIPFAINMDAITIAFSFSATVGIVFGWAPARKASRLNPIDALRSI